MNRCLILFCAVLAALMPAGAGAYTYLGSAEGVGDPVVAVSARTAGMGYAALAAATGAEALFYNPANMLRETERSFSGTLGFTNLRETVEQSGDPTRFSSGYYINAGGISVFYPFESGWAIGAGYRPLFNHDYRHSRITYSSGIETGSRDYDNSGGIGSYTLSAAANLTESLKLGADWGMISGSSSRRSSIITAGTSKKIRNDDSSYSGSRFGFGAGFEMIKEVCFVGARWTSAYSIEDSWSSSRSAYSWSSGAWATPTLTNSEGKLKYSFPAEAGIGINYNFFQRDSSSISVDIIKTYWQNFEYREKKDVTSAAYGSDQDPLYRNTIRVAVGVEHRVSMKLLLRYGFVHIPYYGSSSADMTLLTAGLGFPFGIDSYIDIAAAYGKRTFFGQNIFFTSDEAVDERIFRLDGSILKRF